MIPIRNLFESCEEVNVASSPKTKILMSWSSGKDSAWALHLLRQEPQYEIVGLITTINSEVNRVSMHGTRRRSSRV